MIQINLIPDIKREYLRARRMRDVTISIALLVSLAAAGAVILMLLFLSSQKLFEVTKDNAIEDEYAKLESIEGINELVTIQNQLSLIQEQHENSSANSRLFSILQAINPPKPNDVRFSSARIDPIEGVLVVEGQAQAGYPAVETLAKTIENTKLSYASNAEGGERQTAPLAQNVEIVETSYASDENDKRVLLFEIAITYSQDTFTNRLKEVKFVGPTQEIEVTDSKVRVPESLFVAQPDDQDSEDN